MIWGFNPKLKIHKLIHPDDRLATLQLLEKNFNAKKYKITNLTAYTIAGTSRNFFRFYQSIHVYIRIDDAGNFNLEAEMANTFYDYGLLNKHVTLLLNSIKFKTNGNS
jgi:hypothetical protein